MSPTRLIQALAVLYFIFTMSWSAYAQMPINRFEYKGSSLSAFQLPSSCVPNYSSLNQFFEIDATSKDMDTKYAELDKQIALWTNSLAEVDKIDPALSCYEAALIKKLSERMSALEGTIRATAIASAGVNVSAEYTEKIKKINIYIKKLNELYKGYSGVNRIYGKPALSNRFFPARNRIESAMIYQIYGANFLRFGQNIAFYGWNNKGTINPEVVSLFAGPVRIALNSLISSVADNNTSDKTELAKLRTLTGSGGNIVGSFYLPVFHTKTPDFQTLIQLSPKLATEAPILGTPFKSDTLIANANIGFDFNASVSVSIFGNSSLYAYVRPAYIAGTNTYLNLLKVDDNFFLMQEVVGIDIKNVARIGFVLPPITSTSILRNNTFLLSLQLAPESLVK